MAGMFFGGSRPYRVDAIHGCCDGAHAQVAELVGARWIHAHADGTSDGHVPVHGDDCLDELHVPARDARLRDHAAELPGDLELVLHQSLRVLGPWAAHMGWDVGKVVLAVLQVLLLAVFADLVRRVHKVSDTHIRGNNCRNTCRIWM